jgi:hypothetical protein
MVEERNGGNGDPQWTTRGVAEELDESVAAAGGPIRGPGEGQGGMPKKKRPPRAKARRPSVAARRGEDETERKTPTGRKAKNAGQARNPRARKAKQMGPTGRSRTAVGRTPKGKGKTAAGRRTGTSKGSPAAKRRRANRGKAPGRTR